MDALTEKSIMSNTVVLLLLCTILTLGCQSSHVQNEVLIGTGFSKQIHPLDGAQEAVSMALESLGSQKVKGIIFYENYKEHDSEGEIGQTISNMVPEGTPVVGIRAIPHTNAGVLWEHSIAVMAFGGEEFQCNASYGLLNEDRLALGKEVGTPLKNVRDIALAVVLADPKLSFAPDDISVEDFLHGLHQTLPEGTVVFGGNAEPSTESPGHSMQFYNDQVFEQAVVAMGIGGPIRIIGETGSEFAPSGRTAMVTKSIGKWIVELDGRPAADVYRELTGKSSDDPITFDNVDPIGIDLGDDQLYVRMILYEKVEADTYKAKEDYQKVYLNEKKREKYVAEAVELPEKSLRFVAEVPVGTNIYGMTYRPDPNIVLRSATLTVERALSQIKSSEHPLAILTSSCCSRRRRLIRIKPDADEVLEGIKPALVESVPILGFDAWGELGPIHSPFKGLPYQYQQHSFLTAVIVTSK